MNDPPDEATEAAAASSRNATPFRVFLLIVVLFAAGVRLWRSPWSASDLAVIPDSIEYAVGAQRLATLGHYDIEIEGVAYPPRCPPWFSLMLAPAYVVAPNELGAGIVPVFLLTLCAVAAAFVIGGRLAGEWGAVAAALALACFGEFRRDAMKIMTDVPALAFALWACVMYLRLRRGDARAATWLWAGWLCAAAFALRLELLSLCVPFWLLAMKGGVRTVDSQRNGSAADDSRSRNGSTPRTVGASVRSPPHGVTRRIAHALLFSAPIVAVVLGAALYSHNTFGSWRRTGYHFWLPELHSDLSNLLSPHFLSANFARLGSFWALAAIGFGVIGAWRLLARDSAADRRGELPSLFADVHVTRHLLTFFLLGALPGTVFHLLYFYQDLRFHLLSLAILCIVAGAGLVTFVDDNLRQRTRVLLPLIALTTIALPRSPAPEPHRRFVADALARETPSSALIVTALESVYLEPTVLRGTARHIVPFSRAVEYAGRKPMIEWLDSARLPRTGGAAITPSAAHNSPSTAFVCEFAADENQHQLAAWVRSGVPVYLDASFIPTDFPVDVITGGDLELAPTEGKPWLSRLVVRSVK